MKTAFKKLSGVMLGLTLAMAAKADVYNDNFNTSLNYLTNGVAGTIWDGIYLGAGEFPGGANGAAAGSTLVADANVSSNNVLTVQSLQTDWEGAPDDGFFLFKVVSGDFSAVVHIIGFDNGNFNTAGLQARGFDAQGAPFGGSENWVSWTYFYDQFGIANYFRTTVNGGTTQRPIFEAPANTNRWLRLDRVGDTFYAYERATPSDAWSPRDQQQRTDLAGLPVQVGIMHATFDDGTTARTSMYEQFSLVASNFTTVAAPSAPTGLTLSTNAEHNIVASWTAGAGSDGSVVVVWSGSPLVKEAPANGSTYTGNAFGLGDSLPGGNYYVVFSGSGNSVTISNLIGSVSYNVAVFSFAGSGTARSYNHAPVTASAVSPAAPTSLVFNAPSAPLVAGSARRVPVLVQFDNGTSLDVTASSTFTSSVPSVVSIQAPGRIAALTNGGPVTISATYQGFTSNITVSVVGLSMTHQWRFNEAAGETNIVDAVGGAGGKLIAADGLSTVDGSGRLILSGTTSNFVQLPPDLATNYGAITIETWGSEAVATAGSRFIALNNDANHFIIESPRSLGGPRGGISDSSGAQNLVSAALDVGAEHQYVFSVNGATRTAGLYVDGALVAASTNFTLTPEDVGRTANDWIGRSEGNIYLSGNINEIRLYNGPLDALSIAVDSANGPDSSTSPGALQSLTLTANSPLNEGDTEAVSVSANFANVNNVNATTLVSYSSSNPQVATVNQFGVLTAFGPGTTTITASYQGVNSPGVPVTVVAKPTVMTHRYSFNDANGSLTAADSVGSLDGAMIGTAVITNGQAVLDGVNANAGYVALPSDIMIDYNSITIDTWFTDDNAGTWHRVWDFGNDTANYLFLTLNPGNTLNGRTAIRNTAIGEQTVNFRRPTKGKEHEIIYTQDSLSGVASIYVDGVLVATNNGVTLRPRDVGTTANVWLGRSQFAGDNFFRGSFNDVRIWQGAITPVQAALSYGLGPNASTANLSIANPGAVSSVSVSLSAMTAGEIQQAAAPVNFASLANVNMAPSASNWVSSDSTVAKVSQSGVVTAVGAGSATISATYNGVTGNGSVTVSAAATPALRHRYNFTADGTDSIAGSNATLAATATITGGKVVLTGDTNSYVTLPGHLLDGLSAVSIETWATFTNATAAASRLWDFGDAGHTNWVAFATRSGGAGNTQIRYALSYTNNGGIASPLGETTLQARGNPIGAGSGDNDVQYVVVLNPQVSQATIYINGTLYETFDWSRPDRGNILPLLLSKISNVEGYLGRAVQTNGTPPANYIGNIDEFRIWSGALNAAQIAASYAAGPDNPTIDPGAPSAVALRLTDSTAIVGTTQQPTISGTFGSGSVDLTGSAGVGLSSDNSAVVQVDGNRLRAVGTGAANITASYGGKTDTKAVTVVAKQFRMTHRYSFASDASDSVGGGDGSLHGHAAISAGSVVLDASVNPLTYVSLPSDLIGGYDVVTLEIFGTINVNAANERFFEFGDQANGTGVTYLSMDPNGSRGFTLAPNTPVRNGRLGGGGQTEVSASAAQNNGTVQVVVVADQNAKTLTYYTNGVLAAAVTNNNINVSTIADLYSFLGRSLWLGDPLFNGSIDEFRVYYGAMTASDVAASFAAGPSGTTGPRLSVSVSGNSLIISWPVAGSDGYSLQVSTSLNPTNWQPAGSPTIVGDNNQVTVQVSGDSAFYRLIK